MENILYGDIVGLQVIRPPEVMTQGRINDGPVTEEFMNNLEEVNVTDQMIIEKHECSICLEAFKEGEKCIRLPCPDHEHSFHSGSDKCSGIKPWLLRNNTCPLCRTEFPCSEVSAMDSEPEPENLDNESHILFSNMMQSLLNPNIQNNAVDDLPSEEHLVNTIQNYITTLAGRVHELEDSDLQRAIEASLVDHVES
jgi:hypothetical protein